MIVEFSVKNFRSIKDLQTISFAATGLKSPDEFPEVDGNNIADDSGMWLLVMRRDQFYFTEKREDDSTRLYSLADLKGIRNDADFARDYLRGFYGAIG